MSLSATELSSIRLTTGADDNVLYTDVMIQAKYDLALVDAPESDLILPYTYVYILRELWGYQRTKANRDTDHGDKEQRSEITENTKDLLDYWEGVAGLSGVGILSSGVLSTGLDEDEITA